MCIEIYIGFEFLQRIVTSLNVKRYTLNVLFAFRRQKYKIYFTFLVLFSIMLHKNPYLAMK